MYIKQTASKLFVRRMREVVMDSGLSVPEFAQSVNVCKQTMYGYLNGEKYPQMAIIVKICEKYHVSADYLLGLR